MERDHVSNRETNPRDGWTIVGPIDRVMDVHLQLLAEKATDALNRVEDIERTKSSMGEAIRRCQIGPRE